MTQTELKTTESTSIIPHSLLQFELLLAPAIPMLAILILGLLGTLHMQTNLFIISFVSCAIAVFYMERMIISHVQKTNEEQLTHIEAICVEFLSGHKEARIPVVAEDNTKSLATTLNILLDSYQTGFEKSYLAPQEEINQLSGQLRQLAYELSPIMDGNLTVRSTITAGSPGIIAKLCNGLIEDLAALVQWTQYMAEQIIQTSHSLLDTSEEWAHITEQLTQRIVTVTEAVEKIVTCLQRIDSTLQSSVELAQETQTYIQEEQDQSLPADGAPAIEEPTLVGQIKHNMEQQIRLLETMLEDIHETSDMAEPMMAELYSFAQQFQQANAIVITAAKVISDQAITADEWRQSAQAFSVPDNEDMAEYAPIEEAERDDEMTIQRPKEQLINKN
ncbi:hypothetical protein [Dictyobacter arantiisoli]|uniref:Uncharacterized protein n=1 Tax=Dictyobacter arantiisoli TaxID=2014874 RepID=A0A5A5T772_9CHLR|nr:hypothetical protein [Dictyobacter arantiisoli]GCF06784.1 hypothetical protein KDI_03480 [Dictyobacter arantiisoli]